jgi:hypothetical protein
LFLSGGDLDQFIKRRKGRLMGEGEVLQLFVQIALAIKHIHDRKILHRDLKPGVIYAFIYPYVYTKISIYIPICIFIQICAVEYICMYTLMNDLI